jgi:integrase
MGRLILSKAYGSARKSSKLSARTVATAKAGRHGDGGGLYLVVSDSGAKKWVFRFSFGGRVTEMGLGSADRVSLAEARGRAIEARKLVAAGINPIEARREAARAKEGRQTFGQIADALMASKSAEWRSVKHRAQWRMTLEKYAAPLWARPVDEIETADVLGVLTPLWTTRPETASRLRGRIEAVLDAARAKGHIPRNEANPAMWRGHLEMLLPKPGKLTRGHHAAMAYAGVPAFMVRLREREAMASLALQFMILTAARSGEALGARWDEIDLDAKIWTVPPARMKASRQHRVPLAPRASEILEKLGAARLGEFVFPGQRAGKQLSSMAPAMLLRRMGVGVTAHGFRSAFRDWIGDETHFPREVAEAALAHVAGDATELAYRRSDALEKRRELMAAWAAFCEPSKAENVIPMRAAGARDE